MQIHIKKALLGGYTPEQIITEAVHSNHPGLDKRFMVNKINRDNRANEHKLVRGFVNKTKLSNPELSNSYDNNNRAASQMGISPNYSVNFNNTQEAKTGTLTHKPVNDLANKIISRDHKTTFDTPRTDNVGNSYPYSIYKYQRIDSNVSAKPRIISSARQ